MISPLVLGIGYVENFPSTSFTPPAAQSLCVLQWEVGLHDVLWKYCLMRLSCVKKFSSTSHTPPAPRSSYILQGEAAFYLPLGVTASEFEPWTCRITLHIAYPAGHPPSMGIWRSHFQAIPQNQSIQPPSKRAVFYE